MSDQKKKNSLFGDMNGFGLAGLKDIPSNSKKEIKSTLDSAPTPEVVIPEAPKTNAAKKPTAAKPEAPVMKQQELTQSIKITGSKLEIKKKATKEQISFRIHSTYKEAAEQIFKDLQEANPDVKLNQSDILVAIFVKGLKAISEE